MSPYVPAALRRRARARFVDRCGYCLTAEALIAATFAIEHIVPTAVSHLWLGESSPSLC
jgi:hypothetical protein